MSVKTMCDLGFNTVKRASADKQNVFSIHRYHPLFRMLSTSLRWNIHHRAFKQLQQSLLYTLTAHVTCDRRIVAFSRDFVNLVNKHDATLGFCHIIICHLKKTCEQTLDVLSYIAGLSEHSSINNREWNIKKLGYCFRKQSLAGPGGPHKNDIAFLDVHIIVIRLRQPFIVIIYGNRKIFLGFGLPYHILVKEITNLLRLWDFAYGSCVIRDALSRCICLIFVQNLAY